MKKWFFLLCIVFILPALYFFYPKAATEFQLSSEADTYLVTTKGIYTFQQNDGKLTLLNHQKLNIAEYVHYFFPRGRLENRYLVFVKGWDYPQSYPIAAVSLDFATGKIQTQPTKYFATTGAGQTQNYFYIWQSDTDEARLTQFDKHGKEIQSVTYDGILLASAWFSSDNEGYIQLEAVRDWRDGQFHSQLLTIDESNLELLSEETIYEPENQHYRFSDSLVKGSLLYTPVHSIRDMVSKEVTPSNQLLITNLETGVQEFITLPKYAPELSTRQGDYFFIEHDPTTIQTVGFSVVNSNTREISFVNVSELLHQDLELSGTTLQFFSLDKDNHLLLTVDNELIYLDFQEQKILDRFSLTPDEEAIYIWGVD